MDFSKELYELDHMQQIYATLFSLANKVQIVGDSYFEKLTSRQFMTMLAVLHLPENKATINNISKKLGTSKQNTKQLINSIEKKGYIKVSPSTTDKRALNVTITESGLDVMNECGKIGMHFMAHLFHEFSGEELVLLKRLLLKLYIFDGQPIDGFEEDVSTKTQVSSEDQLITLQEFSKLRKNPK
ncbi:MarR family transcriptional regulator [Bacillus paramycoides]|uniref:MarR family winged helix-turn-helix transcriptional regulator n=1 Tax=Bacillus paramycoides TaxID=2026194 RepID=UPI002244BB51|nr:MarR family transcriptional regulator [Bacillus paramycoides]MCW9134279.1 MarR family transcriptional regulator [Bacillus paramycoides]